MTDAILPILVRGYIRVRDFQVVGVEVDKYGWEYAPFDEGGETDADVVEFHNPMANDPTMAIRREYDADIVERVRDVVGHDLSDETWTIHAGQQP